MKTQLFPYNYRLNFKLKSRYNSPPPPTRLRKHKKKLNLFMRSEIPMIKGYYAENKL